MCLRVQVDPQLADVISCDYTLEPHGLKHRLTVGILMFNPSNQKEEKKSTLSLHCSTTCVEYHMRK